MSPANHVILNIQETGRLLLGVKDIVGVKQYGTRGQKTIKTIVF